MPENDENEAEHDADDQGECEPVAWRLRYLYLAVVLLPLVIMAALALFGRGIVAILVATLCGMWLTVVISCESTSTQGRERAMELNGSLFLRAAGVAVTSIVAASVAGRG